MNPSVFLAFLLFILCSASVPIISDDEDNQSNKPFAENHYEVGIRNKDAEMMRERSFFSASGLSAQDSDGFFVFVVIIATILLGMIVKSGSTAVPLPT